MTNVWLCIVTLPLSAASNLHNIAIPSNSLLIPLYLHVFSLCTRKHSLHMKTPNKYCSLFILRGLGAFKDIVTLGVLQFYFPCRKNIDEIIREKNTCSFTEG